MHEGYGSVPLVGGRMVQAGRLRVMMGDWAAREDDPVFQHGFATYL